MSESQPTTPHFKDEILKRNYFILGHYLTYLIDLGIDFVRKEYVERNAENEFQKFSARSFFTFVLRDYLRKKVKNQIKSILNAAVDCIQTNHVHNGIVDADYLDEVVRKKFKQYSQYDMTILHTNPTHKGHLELEQISKLTFRISTIQATRLLNVKDNEVETYAELVRAAFPTMQQCKHSLNAILSMIDQMVDTYERYMERGMVQIPFYKPTYHTRDFDYVRTLYEYSLDLLDQQIRKIYAAEEEI